MIIRGLAIFIIVFAIVMAHASQSKKHMKYSVLAIEYIWESNKPINPIVISDSEAGAEWYRAAVLKRNKSDLTYVHVVNAALLEKLIAEAELFEHNLQREQPRVSKSAKIISVAIITPKKKNTFFYDRESAASELDDLQKHCNGDESLRSDLLHFLNRIVE
jgi:hypothetical protein